MIKPVQTIFANGQKWMHKLVKIALAALAICLLSSAVDAEPVRRKVLAVYDSAFEPSPSHSLVHARAEMPLNHLGFVVEYRSTDNLPDPAAVTEFAAVLTWFTYDVKRPSEYSTWARRVSERGIPFIIFGQLGAPATERNLVSLNVLLRPMGVAFTSNFVESTRGTSFHHRDPMVMDFERKLDGLLPPYPIIRRLSKDAAVALEVEAPALERSMRSALVTAGPGGALVPGQFALYTDPVIGLTQWLVNPFEIFRRVLVPLPVPVPDTTTVSGRRLYFSHVDGDGWNDTVEMARYRNPPVLAAEVMVRELIEPYPDLPVTVGIITADMDPAYGDGESAQKTARRIFALLQVEVASHSATSPLTWDFYENYDRSRETSMMGLRRTEGGASTWLNAVERSLGITKTVSEVEQKRSQYLSGSRRLPRGYLRDAFVLDEEIAGAAAKTSELAPAGKPPLTYLWTGDALPFEAAIRATRMAGMRNINGGGARVDENYPSIGYVTPIARQVGTERQIYAVDAGDASFATDANGIGSFSTLQTTLDGTEAPRRLKGINLNYHAYAAKRESSLKAIKGILKRAMADPVTPITTSEYAAIADGFFTTRVERNGPMSWSFSDRDGMQTLRVDDVQPSMRLDIEKSLGVLGSTLHAGSLYVALDAAVGDAAVVFKNEDAPAPAGTRFSQLEESNWRLYELKRDGCRLSYSASGFGTGTFTWLDLEAGLYRIEASKGANLVWQAAASVGPSGRLSFTYPSRDAGSLAFAISCAGARMGQPS